jgi:hypothetical protein
MSMPIDEAGLVERFTVLAEIDVTSAFLPFSKEQLGLLSTYHDLVGGVTGRPFFANGIRLSFKAGPNTAPPLLKHAGEDALRSVMIDFRRLW